MLGARRGHLERHWVRPSGGEFDLPCWLVFRLYRLRSPGHPLSLRRETLLLTFVLYLCGLASATLSPNHPSRVHAETAVGIELHPNLASLSCSSAILARGSNDR